MNEQDLQKLKEMVESGVSSYDIAKHFGKGQTTIRYWIKKQGLALSPKISHVGLEEKECKTCRQMLPIGDFYSKTGSNSTYSHCKKCANAKSVLKEQLTKKALIEYKGGKCVRCSNTFDFRVYDFHHTNPQEKDFTLREHKSLSLSKQMKEVDKCILLCANCHHEIHHEIKQDVGYFNKIKGNTESWNENKKNKLSFISKDSCDKCGYDTYTGSLCIVFGPEHKHFRTDNTRIWTQEHKDALIQAQVLCYNCKRIHTKDDENE